MARAVFEHQGHCETDYARVLLALSASIAVQARTSPPTSSIAPPNIQYATPESIPLPLIGKRGIGVGVGAGREVFLGRGGGVLVGGGTGVSVGVGGTGVLVGGGSGVSVGGTVGVEVNPSFTPAAKVGRSVTNADTNSRTMTDVITPAVIHILVLIIVFASQFGPFHHH